jgi:hypothetical protein
MDTAWRSSVGEALFTFDLTAAESFVIGRVQDNGKRSAIGFTAEGFFGTSEPPDPPTVPNPAAILLALLGLALIPRCRRSKIA